MLVASVWKTGSKTTTGSDPTDNLMPFDSPQPKSQSGREQVLVRSYNPSPTDVLSCGKHSGGGNWQTTIPCESGQQASRFVQPVLPANLLAAAISAESGLGKWKRPA